MAPNRHGGIYYGYRSAIRAKPNFQAADSPQKVVRRRAACSVCRHTYSYVCVVNSRRTTVSLLTRHRDGGANNRNKKLLVRYLVFHLSSAASSKVKHSFNVLQLLFRTINTRKGISVAPATTVYHCFAALRSSHSRGVLPKDGSKRIKGDERKSDPSMDPQ